MRVVKVFLLFLVVFLMLGTAVSAQKRWQVRQSQGTGDLISVFFTSSNNGWVAGDEGFLSYTRDGGRSWTRKVLNTAADINEIYFRDNSHGYLVAGRKMFVTRDGGQNWRETFIVNPKEFKDGVPDFLSIRFNSRKQGFIIGSVISRDDDGLVVGSLVLRTVDAGETWRRIDVPSKVELFHLDFDGKSSGWIVGDKGTILATTDNGGTWETQRSGTGEVLYNVEFRDDRDGYTVGTNGTILRTEDGGANWMKVRSPVMNTLFRVDFADDKNGWIVGSRGTILRTSDKGRSWIEQTSSTRNHLYGLFIKKKYGWCVGKDGIVISYKK